MIEVTVDETILWPVKNRIILHHYGEPLEAEVQVYSLEEVVAEKLRALLQHSTTLNRRGWSRSRARDYYDLWQVLGAYKGQMDLARFESLLLQKCPVRDVTFEGLEEFFHEPMLAYVASAWDLSLGLLVPGLPPFETVIEELRPQVAALVSFR